MEKNWKQALMEDLSGGTSSATGFRKKFKDKLNQAFQKNLAVKFDSQVDQSSFATTGIFLPLGKNKVKLYVSDDGDGGIRQPKVIDIDEWLNGIEDLVADWDTDSSIWKDISFIPVSKIQSVLDDYRF